jgi:hypothetical protein
VETLEGLQNALTSQKCFDSLDLHMGHAVFTLIHSTTELRGAA